VANEIKLEIYSFGVREIRSTEFLELDNFLGSNNFMNFFKDFIKQFENNITIDSKQKKSIQFLSSSLKIESSSRMISGLIESGDYGIESKIVDAKTSQKKYVKKIGDLDIKPFYFLLHIPKGKTKGFIVLQRLGHFGINTIFTQTLNTFFKSKYGNCMLDLGAFVSKSLAKEFLNNGGIKEFSLRRYDLPSDIADKIGLKDYKEDVLSIEFKIVAKQGSVLNFNNKVKAFLNNPNGAFFEVESLKKIGFDGNNKSSMKVSLGNNTRTIDLSDTLQIRPYYDINDEVKKDSKNGHPILTSIDKIAKDHLKDLLNEIE
jgi:hypothetical protein